jgi:hypothetical protein
MIAEFKLSLGRALRPQALHAPPGQARAPIGFELPAKYRFNKYGQAKSPSPPF